MTDRRQILVAFALVTIALTALNWFCQISTLGAMMNVEAPEAEADRLLALAERCAFVTSLPLSAVLEVDPARGSAFVVGALNALLMGVVVAVLYRAMLRRRAARSLEADPWR